MKYYKKNKNNKIIYIMLTILITLILFILFFSFIYKINNEKKEYCGINQTEYFNIKSKEYSEIKEIKDYFYYGENLSISDNSFLDNSNNLNLKTVLLKNICNGKVKTFILNSFIDLKINLSQLEDGEYELFVVDNFKEKRLFTKLDIKSFNTTTYNNIYKNITFNKNKYDYVFLRVKTKPDKANKFDIYIDPSYKNSDFSLYPNIGYKSNGYWSYQLTFDFSKKLCEEFNNNGFKCKLTKNNKENVVNIYGKNNRLYNAYMDKSKYYINIQLLSVNDTNVSGIHLEKSYYSSGKLSNDIMNNIMKIYEFNLNKSLNLNKNGVLFNPLIKGTEDSILRYDGNFNIRESGGKATFAGRFSKDSKKNFDFAAENIYGMEAISLNLGYITNKNDVDNLIKYQDSIVKEIVKTFKEKYSILYEREK